MQFDQLKRREFISLLGGAATWPLAARAQQSERMRLIGLQMGFLESDPAGQSQITVFRSELPKLGWMEGGNLRIEIRWGGADPDRHQTLAKELVNLRPDAILTQTTLATSAVARETRTLPIVFAIVADPIGNGFAASLAHPGGNLTAFTSLDSAISGKWVQLLKEVAPRTERVALLFNSATAMPFQFLTPSFQAAASTFAVQVSEAPVQAKEEIEGVIAAQARSPGSGLIVMPDTFNVTNRDLIIAAAARYRVPAMYFNPTFFVRAGGLVGYSNDYAEESRRAAGYIDKILRGAKPADLPIQQPTKFEAHHQSEDRQGSRPRCARASPASRRRG